MRNHVPRLLCIPILQFLWLSVVSLILISPFWLVALLVAKPPHNSTGDGVCQEVMSAHQDLEALTVHTCGCGAPTPASTATVLTFSSTAHLSTEYVPPHAADWGPAHRPDVWSRSASSTTSIEALNYALGLLIRF
ncbi:hypothetical protein C8R44DRAFT_989062 [Mycena epipterygia]|nr:hypothetical protein C8R44DRAFT_989062 [Mycena epipterygia]